SLLTEPFSWTALKRTLRQGEIRIEDLGRFIGLTSTVSLEPDPIPLDVKVVLFGDRMLYYLLAAFDPDVAEHFKVLADLEDDVDRTPASEAAHARLIAALVRRSNLKPVDRAGTALLIEHAARGSPSMRISLRSSLTSSTTYWPRPIFGLAKPVVPLSRAPTS